MARRWATGDEAGAPAEDAGTLRRAFERPAQVVLTVCQMLAGLGLAIALVLKVYMLVFTDQICTADGATLGNAIRCTPMLEVLAQAIVLVAALRMAAFFFSAFSVRVIEPLALALAGALLMVVSQATGAEPAWQAALLIVALFATVAGAFAGLHLSGENRR